MKTLFSERHSIRRFKDTPISRGDLKWIVTQGTLAPNGRNAQNWRFIILSDPDLKQRLGAAISVRHRRICEGLPDDHPFHRHLSGTLRLLKAPHLILAYALPYPVTGADALRLVGASEEAIAALESSAPGIQNVSAALENILLAAVALGAGGCWMTGPLYAASEINAIVGVTDPDWQLVALSPLGYPAEGECRSPGRKPLSDILTFL